MSIDQHDDTRTLDTDHGSEEGTGPCDRLHVRAVRPSVDAPQAAGDDRPGSTEGLCELPVEVLEHAARIDQARTQASRVERRRDDHKRVTCDHCGARVLTRGSGAMWGHLADGVECTGSKTWDYTRL